MERKEIENIYLNGKMMDDDSDTILERFAALDEAAAAIGEAYAGDKPEDYEYPADFVLALDYVTGLLHRLGSPAPHPDDAARAVEVDLGYARLQKSDSWLPETPEQIALVEELLIKGSHLAIEDIEPAYSSHTQGRNHEILDPYDTTYNKFGVLVHPRN